MKFYRLYIFCVSVFAAQWCLAQNDVYQGEYHAVNPSNITPIEKKMAEVGFCEIDDYYIRTPQSDSMALREIAKDHVKDLYGKASQAKRDFLNGTYYAVGDRYTTEAYEPETGTFTLTLPQNIEGLYLVSHDKCFSKNIYSDIFTTPPIDAATSYEIETNPCQIVVFVRFTGDLVSVAHGDIVDHGLKEAAVCYPVEVYIVNKNTGEIYLDYTPTDAETSTKAIDDQAYIDVNHEPMFPGRQEKLLQWISLNLRYPEDAAKHEIQGKLLVKFIVTKDGSIGQVEVMRHLNPELDAEAVRVVKSLPKFIPGKDRWKAADRWYILPITFRLTQ